MHTGVACHKATRMQVHCTALPDLFEQSWFCRQGLTEQCQVVVGVPMLTSAANLSFWLHLCNASGADGAIDLVREFKEHEADKEDLAHFTRTYNRNLVQKVQIWIALGH